MKLKLNLVVASMSVLSFISYPAIADSQTVHKHHRHHHRHHVKHHMKHHAVAEYKDMGNLPAEPVCMISQSSMIMVEMTQNLGRAMPNPCNPGWYNRIQFSGGVNADFGKFGNRNINYMGENYQRVSLNDAYFNVGATVSEWAKAFASLSYNTATINANPAIFKNVGASEFSAAYSNNIGGSNTNTVQLEQAYAVFSDADTTPFLLEIGKGFQDFSRYEIHPITASLTQVMSETLATAFKVGFIASGFNGSLYAFDDPLSKKTGNSSKTTNYGLALGYSQPSDQLGWDIGAAYLYNLLGVNDIAYSVVNFTGTTQYNSRASGLALYGDVNSGPFTLNARYTTALQRFSVNDMTKNGNADLTKGSALLGSGVPVTPLTSATGAKPWAAGIQVAYGFEAWCKNQNIYLGYQASNQAAGMNIPKGRWELGYDADLFGKNTLAGIQWDSDRAYSKSNGGPGNSTNLVSIRTSVKFG